jgi:exopolyphosphatase/guanosine-5'-triphosphate,3'-diphosphate pyrophosphatase
MAIRRAVIALGTNTTRLLVVEGRPDGSVERLEERQIGTRLGEGLRSSGTLSPAGAERTLAAVRGFMIAVHEYGAELSAIATSAMRRADDAATFAARMRAATGVELQVLGGRAEAEASFRGASYGLAPSAARVAVVDVGGGSTECAVGANGLLQDAASVEIGSVRVSERFPDLLGTAPGRAARAAAAAARLEIAALLAGFARFAPVAEARCVAGTATTLAAVTFASSVDAVGGRVLSRAALDATLERLLDLDLPARRALPGMLAQRADIVAGGGLILSESLRRLGLGAGIVEHNDLLLGFLLASWPPVPESDGAQRERKGGVPG